MPKIPRRQQLAAASEHLRQSDRRMRRVIDAVGPCRLPTRRNHFATVVRSIVSQQISTAAARTIHGRLSDRLGEAGVCAANLLRFQVDELRSVGLSRQKAAYLLDLAAKTADGQIRFDRFSRMDDEEIITALTRVNGIGRWTVEMLLIFSLGRLDVLPCDDLGIRKAIARLYQLDALPNKQQCWVIADPWRPYASVASWYCWRSLEVVSDTR